MTHHHRWAAGALIAAAALFSGTAHADPPVVTLVPRATGIELSRALPAGVPFKVKLAVSKEAPAQGTIMYWPAGRTSCERQPGKEAPAIPSGAGRFALAGDVAATGELSAELPALQFSVAYCLALELRRGLTAAQAERAAKATVAASKGALTGLDADVLRTALAAQLAKTLGENDIQGFTPDDVDHVLRAAARDYVLSAAAIDHVAADQAATTARTTTAPDADRAIDALKAAHVASLRGEQPAPSGDTFLVIGDVWFSPELFWSNRQAPEVIDEAAAYLRALRATPGGPPHGVIDPWLSAVLLAKTDFPAAQKIWKDGALKPLAPGVPGIWDGSEIVGYATLLDGAAMARRDEAFLVRAVRQLRERDARLLAPEAVAARARRRSAKPVPPTPRLQDALAKLAVARKRQVAANADAGTTEARRAITEAAAVLALTGFITEALRELRVDAAFTSQDLRVPETTPSPQNYASIDLGVAVGRPLVENGDGEWLWMPYIGVNLYVHGVDRTFPLESQRGGWWRTRLALTLGFSLDEPTFRNRELDGLILGKIPFLAIGARVSQYTRVSAGVMLFELPDDSPAEDDADLGAAWFVGYSLDLDLLKWIKGNASGYGGF